MENYKDNITNQLDKLVNGTFSKCSLTLLEIDRKLIKSWNRVKNSTYLKKYGFKKPIEPPYFWIEKWVNSRRWNKEIREMFNGYESQIV